jgi:hypothetical protein
MNDVCDQRVVTLDLVDLNSPDILNNPERVGIMYIFKDFNDDMYITVSLNTTWSVTTPGYFDQANGGFNGQYLYVQPALSPNNGNDVLDAGRLWVWDNLGDLGINVQVPTAYTDMAQADGIGGR